MKAFVRYIGIDYSGASTLEASLPGLRVYSATGNELPTDVPPPRSPRKCWTRRGLAEWLTATLGESTPTLVGIDHGLSFPLAYFDRHNLPRSWDSFLDDFCTHWPTDQDTITVEAVRRGTVGNGAARGGETRWRRLTERRAGAAKSVFHFDVQGSVAKSTHSGIPWLRHLRRTFGPAIYFWPFDGWTPPAGRHVIAEVYPSLWRHLYRKEGLTSDQQDAYAACRWLQEFDHSSKLQQFFQPQLSPADRAIADVEGWILGVDGA